MSDPIFRIVDGVAVEMPAAEAEALRAEWAEVQVAPAVPQEISLFQARAALLVYGAQIDRPNLLAEVDALVAGLPNGAAGMSDLEANVIREAWANAAVVKRSSPALNLIFPALGLTQPEQLDQLFIIAAGITA